MIALVEQGRINFGAIALIDNGNMYIAERGTGATLNGHLIHANTKSLKERFLCFEMQPSAAGATDMYLQLKHKVGLLETLCSGFNFCMVASGKIEGIVAIEPYGEDYDYAPGTLLVEEAGGIVANIGKHTHDLSDRNFIAANSAVFQELTAGPEAMFPIKQ